MTNEMLMARNEYIGLIKKELHGPGSEISFPDDEHELISSSPDIRYSIGILFPRGNKHNADENDQLRVEESIEEIIFVDEIQSNEGEILDNREIKEPLILDEESNLDEEISLSTQNRPSSAGITFFAKGNSNTVLCKIRFGTYRRAQVKDCRIPFVPNDPETYRVPNHLDPYVEFDKKNYFLKLITRDLTGKIIKELKQRYYQNTEDDGLIDALFKLNGQLKSGYVREPHKIEVLLDFSKSNYIDQNRKLDGTHAKITALRRHIKEDIFSISIMLVNDDERESRGERCIFQPEIIVATEHNNFCFQEYSGISDFDSLDEEEQSLELQYRKKRVYGTGLGTSIDWEIDVNGKGVLKNDFFPVYEVPNMDFDVPENSGISSCALSMKYLSDLDHSTKSDKLSNLNSIVEAYDHWIEELMVKAKTLDTRFFGIAKTNIEGCKEASLRMKLGLQTLTENQEAWTAFELSNRAMYMQRVHLRLQQETSNMDRFPNDSELEKILTQIDYYNIDTVIEDRYSWRPFQIAFLLMCINSIVEENGEEREEVDLIWFPTGGGKTEAYLGLTAFTIFFRRLAHLDISDGTTVIMRYTLRLLAAQQFTRASTLICACEYIRQDATLRNPLYGKYPLGNKPITIGLWIGGEHTPNRNEEAKEKLNRLLRVNKHDIRDVKDRHNKFQVLKCPWCGTKLVKELVDNKIVGQFGYRMRNNRHFEIFCPQESCFYNQADQLPIQVVDEELYYSPPTLLFATVDKFAMLPWKKEVGSFFAIGEKNRAPELIIQDELHLISGPLGTIVGLYEVAIDALCHSKGVSPKIVASTATIRRAKEQCSALYNRKVNQFPHPAIDSDDSFFARESTINYDSRVFGRKYIGLMPSGKTKAMMEVRTIAALLQKINTMDVSDKIKDNFWTLTVYFNSLKDLGKCLTLVDDDVKDFIKRTAFRLGTAKDGRLIGRADELTSRVTTTELNETLDKLEKWTYSKENIMNRRYPSNVLLATNMISVGIDVARLNVMLLVGQPKLTSEYIQASSRVGRTYPGVAFIMYDGTKSRDRSHYEQFKAYHESFYKFVEPTGATPFSKPARDKALHAVIISLLRFLEPELYLEKNAGTFTRTQFQSRIAAIRDVITKRNTEILSRININMEDDTDEIIREIDIILEKWESLASKYTSDHFSYGIKHMIAPLEAGKGRLMKSYNSDPFDTESFDTLTSMRNVDSSVAGNVIIWEE